MKSVILIGLSLICNTIIAQNYVDLARIDFNYGIPSPFQETPDIKGRVSELTTDVTLPIVLSPTLNLITGLNSEWIRVDIYSNESTQSIHSIMLKMGANIEHSENWSGTYMLMPKISSDMAAINLKDYQVGALGMLKYTKTASINYKFGIYVNSDLFGPMIVPVFGFYKKSGKFESNFALPINADINYELMQNMRLGIKFIGTNKSYHLNRATDQYLVKINNEIGPYLQWALGNLRIVTQVGTTVLRSFRTYQIDDKVDYALSLYRPKDNRLQLNDDFKDGIFIKTSLIYRFSLSND